MQHARNATLADLAEILQAQHARKLDVVVGAGAVRSEDGILRIKGTDAQLDVDGVTSTEGSYRPTDICDEGISAKLGIPLPYLRRMRNDHVELYDRNVNGWLEQEEGRAFMIRCFKADDGEMGVARAWLSDRFKRIDNLDTLTAGMAGIRATGMEVNVTKCDLTERRMRVHVNAPEVRAYAPKLLGGYRSPFTGQTGQDLPVVTAGIRLDNSETGGGALSIVPEITVLICTNGMTITRDALRSVHLGGKMDEGVIQWSTETQDKTLDLITARARDAVATFLNVDYMSKVIEELERDSDTPIGKPVDTIQTLGKKLNYTEEQQAGILDHFIKGADTTAGGILHAVTSYAQTVESADAAAELQDSAMRAFELAVQSA